MKLSIRTRRLVVRPFTLSDYPVWAQAKRELLPKQNEFDHDPPARKELSRAKFARWLKTKRELQRKDIMYKFGAFDRKTGRLYGQLDIMVIARHKLQVANLGYAIHNPHWGRGYAQEAARALLDIAFRELRLHRIEAGADPRNHASIGVAKGIGMSRECLRRKYYFDGRKWIDMLTFVAIAEDFGGGQSRTKPTLRMELGS